MRKLISIALAGLLMVSLTSCGYSGFYRYPCQDPKNWKNAECNPPVCEASGTCTKDVIGNIQTTEQTTTEGNNNG
jgi:predicted small lipoprotein YifL